MVFWFTGLSGSGKSTIATAFQRHLYQEGYVVEVLDGDNIRTGLNNNLTFSESDRAENIRRIAEVAKLFCQNGIVTICSFISPTIAMRDQARSIIGPGDFIEVFVDTPLAICEQRDVKGLYAKARRGELKGFTGIDSPFEAPENPEIRIDTTKQKVDEAVWFLFGQLVQRDIREGKRKKEKGKRVKYSNTDDETLIAEDQFINYSNKSFEDLYVWQLSMQLYEEIHALFKKNNDFVFRDQICRSSLSIPSNIAEGFERSSNKEFIRFLFIAKGSCGELRTQIILARNIKYISQEEANDLMQKAIRVSKMLAGLIKTRSSF